MESQTIMIRKDAIVDLVELKERFDAVIESLELMSDKIFMDSYKKAKVQIQKKEFADWNEI